MEVTRIEEGLWRWTAPHPEWKPTDDWEQDVGCVYWEAEDAVVLVDPLVPADATDRTRFLEALDRDVGRVDGPVVILLTCTWHDRSAAELAERYGGRVVQPGEEPLPAEVASIAAPSADEVVYWLSGPATLVPGDALITTDGRLTLCPDSWLQGASQADLARELHPLLELPVERVLTSHGAPLLGGGREALAAALDQTPA